jgi:hypothetical protein
LPTLAALKENWISVSGEYRNGNGKVLPIATRHAFSEMPERRHSQKK